MGNLKGKDMSFSLLYLGFTTLLLIWAYAVGGIVDVLFFGVLFLSSVMNYLWMEYKRTLSRSTIHQNVFTTAPTQPLTIYNQTRAMVDQDPNQNA